MTMAQLAGGLPKGQRFRPSPAVQGHPQLHRVFEARQGYTRHKKVEDVKATDLRRRPLGGASPAAEVSRYGCQAQPVTVWGSPGTCRFQLGK